MSYSDAYYLQTIFLFHCPNGDGKRIIDVATGQTAEMAINVACKDCVTIAALNLNDWMEGKADPAFRGYRASVLTLKRYYNGQWENVGGGTTTVTSPQLGKFYRDVRRALDESGSSLRDLFVNLGSHLAGAVSSDESVNALTKALDDALHSETAWDQKGLEDQESQRLNAEVQETHAKTSAEWSPELKDLLLDSLRTIPSVGKKRGNDG